MAARASVVIPIKNERHHVGPLLERLERMNSLDVEFIAVDDQSNDGSGEALRSGQARLKNLTVLTGTGSGVAAARNLALRHVKGDWVWFADCDDTWDPNIVARMLAEAEREDADLVVCNALKLTEGDVTTEIADAPRAEILEGPMLFTRLAAGEIQGHLWNKLFSRELLGPDPFPATRAHSDFGGLLILARRVRRTVLLPVALYRYEVRAGSILNSRAYRWDDLIDCSAAAHATAAALGWPRGDRRLSVFDLTLVVLPLLNESIRREAVSETLEVKAVRARCWSRITVPGLVALIAEGRVSPAAKLALFKLSPRLYCTLYRRYRLRRWRSIDTALNSRR